MVNDSVPGSSPPKTGIDPLAGTAPWPAYVEAAPRADDDEEAAGMTPLGPGLNDGELLPGDTPPIENDQPHSEIAAHTRLI
jgi:hypothetical protein